MLMINNLETVDLSDLLMKSRPKINPNPFKVQDQLKGSALTLELLLNFESGIFAFGESFEAVYREYEKIRIRWIAKKETGTSWTIYFGDHEWTWYAILTKGQKIHDSRIVENLVKCDFESFEMYRP